MSWMRFGTELSQFLRIFLPILTYLANANNTIWQRAAHSGFTVCVFCECFSVCMCASFPFSFEGRMWELIVLVPDYCLSIVFVSIRTYS